MTSKDASLCECGCGEATTIYRGVPRRFVLGHHARGEFNPRYGKPCSDDLRRKIGDARRGQGTPWWIGRRHTQACKEKISACRTGVATTPRLGREKACEVCKRLVYVERHREQSMRFCSKRCAGIGTATGELNPFYGRQHTDEVKDTLRNKAIAQRASRMILPSSSERVVHAVLRKMGVEFLTEQPIGRWCVDIYIPNLSLIIFVDGCYWHGCQEHCPGSKKPKSDNARVPYLTRMGFKTAIVWEHAINVDADGLVREVVASCS